MSVHSSGNPAGTIIPCGNSAALPRTLLCNGAAVSRTTYSALFAAIGTTYGVGDGSTTYNIPDTRGLFLRGVGTNPSNANNTATLGSRQLDDNKSHTHGPNGTGEKYFIQNGGGDSGAFNWVGSGPQFQRASQTASSGGTETRPANVGVNYCIAY